MIVRSSCLCRRIAAMHGEAFVSAGSGAPTSKHLEAIVHTFLRDVYAGSACGRTFCISRAIGPALTTPLARLMGLRVVVTHHGPDYDRQKWSHIARLVLKLGERWGMRWSNARIVISEGIRHIVRQKHNRDSTLIPNGVELPVLPEIRETIDAFGLQPGRYIVMVSRLVPEKRHLDLIEAFRLAALGGWKLAIVGASDHPDTYVRKVLDAARVTPGVVCTGFQGGRALAELFGHAGCSCCRRPTRECRSHCWRRSAMVCRFWRAIFRPILSWACPRAILSLGRRGSTVKTIAKGCAAADIAQGPRNP